MNRFEPKLITVLREGYPSAQFPRDLIAGVIVGIVAVPLAIAFAIASGVSPERGLYTAVVAGFLISALSGSRVQIGGPTGAFVVLIYGIVQRHGYDGLVVATVLAGLILVVMGMAQLGTLIQYIPYPVTVGFTTGIAVIIASGQIRDALGLTMGTVPAEFLPKVDACIRAIGTFNPWAVAVALTAVSIIVFLPRLLPRLPGSLVALLVTTGVVHWFRLPVETIGEPSVPFPSGLPTPHLPAVNWASLPALFSPALSIALLAGIESLLSAVVADGMTGGRHRPNMELIAQGAANIACPIFGGIPATGAIARTATNVKSSGRTPVAGIVHAIVVLIVLVAAGRWAALIPMATLAGILLVVAYNMSESHLFWTVLRRSTRSDALVLATTFLLTVLIDLTAAIPGGCGARITVVHATDGGGDGRSGHSGCSTKRRRTPSAAATSRLESRCSMFTEHASSAQRTSSRPHSVMCSGARGCSSFTVRDVLALDATGLRALEELYSQAEKEGTTVVLAGAHAQPLAVLARSGLLDRWNEENLTSDLAPSRERVRSPLELVLRYT